MPRINVKVEMIEAGMATAAINTARQFRIKSQTTAENQMFDERMDGSFDEIGNIVHHLKLYAGRQLGTQIIELASHVVRDAHSIDSRLTENLNGNDVLAGNSFAK
jgi:hypothetical protein